MLTALGLTADEEEIYRRLVPTPEVTAAKLAADLGQDPHQTMTALIALVGRGLAMQSADQFSAAPPAVALGALLRQQHDSLRAAELDLADLAEQHRRAVAHRQVGDVIEVITELSAVRHRFAQLQQGARREIRAIVVPGQHVVPPGANSDAAACLSRGVRYRVIVARAALAQPGLVATAIAEMRHGEEIRVVDQVPVKMIIADAEVAMLPLLTGRHTEPASVLIRASGLLDAMIALFEILWDRAYPLSHNVAGDALIERHPGDIDEVDAQVLALLLAGLTDQAVAGQLGMSLRTLQRRISALMEKAGVETRIQLGWRAAQSSWA